MMIEKTSAKYNMRIHIWIWRRLLLSASKTQFITKGASAAAPCSYLYSTTWKNNIHKIIKKDFFHFKRHVLVIVLHVIMLVIPLSCPKYIQFPFFSVFFNSTIFKHQFNAVCSTGWL